MYRTCTVRVVYVYVLARPMAEEVCSMSEFAASFKSVEDAFFYLGFSSLNEIKERRLQIAAAAREPIDSPDEGYPFVVVADVETNGGKGGQFVIQLAFVTLDDQLNEISATNEYVKLPDDNRYINPCSQSVHKITLNKLDRDGKPASDVLDVFFKAVSSVRSRNGRVVFHNAAFDAKAIAFTAEKCGYTSPFPFTRHSCFCTMTSAKQRLNLKDSIGRTKAPSNKELHNALVGPVPDETALHDALADVRVTAASYAAGVRMGWW